MVRLFKKDGMKEVSMMVTYENVEDSSELNDDTTVQIVRVWYFGVVFSPKLE